MCFPSRLDFKLISFSAAALLIVSALALDSSKHYTALIAITSWSLSYSSISTILRM